MAGQPGLDLGVLVGGVVVHHHMQLPTRIGLGDELEEGQELAVAMARLAGVGHLTGRHLQGGKQRGGAVPDIVVGPPLNSARRHRPDRLGAFQRLDLGLLVPTEHDGARSGGSRYSPTTSRTRASSCGSVENLKVSVCQGLTSGSAQTLATVLWLSPSSVASSREDQWGTPRCSGGGPGWWPGSPPAACGGRSGGGHGGARAAAGGGVPPPPNACARRSPSGERPPGARRSRDL